MQAMIGARRLLPAVTALALLAPIAVPARAATKQRTCFYYANSSFGLWATRNVSCRTARRVYHDATSRLGNGLFNGIMHVDGYRCRMNFDGGGSGTCTASRHRRIHFEVP